MSNNYLLKLNIMKTTKKHQLKRLQKLAVKVEGLIKLAEYEQEFKEATRLREVRFQLTQLVFKFGL